MINIPEDWLLGKNTSNGKGVGFMVLLVVLRVV